MSGSAPATGATGAAGEVEGLACRSYTYARRYPLVIGRIGGYSLPSPVTPAQAVTFVGSLLALLQSRGVWAHLGGVGNVVVLAALPLALTWTVRHLRVEGRSPLRTLVSALAYLTAPRGGLLHGRPHRAPRPARLAGPRVFVTPAPAAPPAMGGAPAAGPVASAPVSAVPGRARVGG